VGVPGAGEDAAVLDLDEANAAFDQAAGGEELAAEFLAVIESVIEFQAVELFDVVGLF
jgi:hypothetical protein